MKVIEEGSGGENSYFDLPLAEIPQLTIRYTQLTTDVALQERIAELLTGLYEEARIKEQKDTPTIAVLETAYPPEIKYRPRRVLIVGLTFACSVALAVFLALFADYLADLRRSSPADFELLNQVRKEITDK